MTGFFSKSPASDWMKRKPSAGEGDDSKNGNRGGSSYGWDGPTGEARAESVLFEESGQYGKVFILRLSEFLKAFGAQSPRTLASMQLICEMALRDAVGTQGNYSLHGGSFFVFRFGRVPDDEARRQAHAVVNVIGRRLLGDHFVPFPPEVDPVAAPDEAADARTRETDTFLATLREEAREAADSDWEILPASERGPVGVASTAEIAANRTERTAREEAREATPRESDRQGGAAPTSHNPKAVKAAER